MPLFSKINGSHKEMTDCNVKVGGVWKQAAEVLVKVNGKWEEVWSGAKLFMLYSADASSATYSVKVNGINSTNDKVTFENVRFIVRENGKDYGLIYPDGLTTTSNNYQITYKNNNGITVARATITLKPPNTVEIFVELLYSNNIDWVEFSFSRVYKSG